MPQVREYTEKKGFKEEKNRMPFLLKVVVIYLLLVIREPSGIQKIQTRLSEEAFSPNPISWRNQILQCF